jgi:CubicO group peptidase (beta-lactamase class C family)
VRRSSTRASGFADRAHEVPNTAETRFGIASGCKGFTALVVMSLVNEGVLDLSSTPDYLAVLRGHPTKFPPGERFEYCNRGFVVLALMAEVGAKTSFYELGARRVFEPAAMMATEYLRSDQLPGSAAIGYLATEDGWRTNHFHLPIRGSGDGGCYSTLGDMARFWPGLFGGKILPRPLVDEMVRPQFDVPKEGLRYGPGILDPSRSRDGAVRGHGCGGFVPLGLRP